MATTLRPKYRLIQVERENGELSYRLEEQSILFFDSWHPRQVFLTATEARAALDKLNGMRVKKETVIG